MNAALIHQLVPCLGWTLLHFVWQGLAIAGWLALCLRVLRKGSPNQRYLAGCLALTAMALAPVITFRHLSRQEFTPPVVVVAGPSVPAPQHSAAADAMPGPTVIAVFTRTPPKPALAQKFDHVLAWLVCAWALGVFVLSSRLLAGWFNVRKLRKKAAIPLAGEWTTRLAVLMERLQTTRSVRLLQSALVEVPTVIGWLRPVILLPASSLSGLTPAQLEAVLAHELAHIRRHDYLVNLWQSAVETLLFYHPAVWWVSRRIREEREHCCDDLAVRVCGDRAVYARALATLEELRPVAGPALAANGAPLLGRIRRLAGRPDKEVGRPGWLVAAVVTLTVAAAVTTALHANRVVAAEGVRPSVNQETKSAGTNASSGDATANSTNTTPLPQRAEPQDRNLFLQWEAPPRVSKQMPNRFGPTNLLYNSKSRQEIIAKLESIRLDSVHYDGLPLSEVISDLSVRARKLDPDQKGINFYIIHDNPAPRPSEPAVNTTNGFLIPPVQTGPADTGSVIIKINPALRDIRLGDLLVAITRNSDRPIGLAIEDYAVVFWLKPNDQTPLYSQVFRIDPQTLFRTLTNLSPGGASSSTDKVPSSAAETNTVARITGMAGFYFTAAGVDFAPGSGKSIFYNDRKETLLVHATAADLDIIAAALEALNQTPPPAAADRRTGQTNPDSHGSTDAIPAGNKAQLSIRIFHINPENLYQALASLSPGGDGSINHTGAGADSVTKPSRNAEFMRLVTNYFIAAGVDFTHDSTMDNSTANSGALPLPHFRLRSTSGFGKGIFFDDRTETLVVTATAEDMDIIDAGLKSLNALSPVTQSAGMFGDGGSSTNHPRPEINIKAKIIELKRGTGGTLDFNWSQGTNGLEVKAISNNVPLSAFVRPGSGMPGNVVADVPTTNSVVAQATRVLTGAQAKDMLESLMRKHGAEVLSMPQVSTADNRQAQIEIVDVDPVLTGITPAPTGKPAGTNLLQTQMMEFGTVLVVQPHVLDDGDSIVLDVKGTVTEFLGYDRPPKQPKKTVAQPLPRFRLRQLTSNTVVKDGETLVLSGEGAEELNVVKDKVPMLGDMPLLGRLFRSSSTNTIRKDLIIFLTPTLVNPDGTPVHPSKPEK